MVKYIIHLSKYIEINSVNITIHKYIWPYKTYKKV